MGEVGSEGAGERRRDKEKIGRKRRRAGVEGREESEGQKDRSCDKSWGGNEGRCYFSAAVVCSSGPAGKLGNGTLKHFTCTN